MYTGLTIEEVITTEMFLGFFKQCVYQYKADNADNADEKETGLSDECVQGNLPEQSSRQE